jgi:hypothetical protein
MAGGFAAYPKIIAADIIEGRSRANPNAPDPPICTAAGPAKLLDRMVHIWRICTACYRHTS